MNSARPKVTGSRITHRYQLYFYMLALNRWKPELKTILFSIMKSVHFSSVAQSCPTLCDFMKCSTQGLPVHHHLPESTQTHVHRVGDAIQPSHPLSSPSLLALNLSQHQGLFKWVSSSHQVAEVLEFQLQHQSFIFIIDKQYWIMWLIFGKKQDFLILKSQIKQVYLLLS